LDANVGDRRGRAARDRGGATGCCWRRWLPAWKILSTPV